jgi:polyhydroxyalkanoate synthesis regulator phasin
MIQYLGNNQYDIYVNEKRFVLSSEELDYIINDYQADQVKELEAEIEELKCEIKELEEELYEYK